MFNFKKEKNGEMAQLVLAIKEQKNLAIAPMSEETRSGMMQAYDARLILLGRRVSLSFVMVFYFVLLAFWPGFPHSIFVAGFGIFAVVYFVASRGLEQHKDIGVSGLLSLVDNTRCENLSHMATQSLAVRLRLREILAIRDLPCAFEYEYLKAIISAEKDENGCEHMREVVYAEPAVGEF